MPEASEHRPLLIVQLDNLVGRLLEELRVSPPNHAARDNEHEQKRKENGQHSIHIYRMSLSARPFVSRANSALTPLIAQATAT